MLSVLEKFPLISHVFNGVKTVADTPMNLSSIHEPITVNVNLNTGSVIENTHGSITINNSAIQGTDISNIHGNISIASGVVNSSTIKDLHGDVLIIASQSVGDVFIKASGTHSGIAAPEIISVKMDATHGTAALKAVSLKDIDIKSIHNPVLIDARQLENLNNVSVNTVHGNLLVLFDPLREKKTSALVSQIKFRSVHGQIVMVPYEKLMLPHAKSANFETIDIDQTRYEQIKALSCQPLTLGCHL